MKDVNIRDFSGSVAILQLGDLENKERVATYIKSIPKHSIVLIGEYVVDSFFSQDWGMKPESCLKDKNKLDIFMHFQKNTDIHSSCLLYSIKTRAIISKWQ